MKDLTDVFKICTDNLYLKYGALLLADVFEKFGNRCLENYGLSPSHYLSPSALSWDAMLSMTKVELDPISDVDIYVLYKKRMRGGISYISKRYSKVSNKYLTSYDPKKSLHTWTKIIHTVMLCRNILQQLDLNGRILLILA